MALAPEIERAIDKCFAAVLQPRLWTSALDELAASLGGRGCNFLGHDRENRPVDLLYSTEMGCWNELWHLNREWVTDPISPRSSPRVRRGYRSLLQSDLFTEEEVRSSRFHQEIAGPSGCRHWISSSFMLDDIAWCLPVFRDAPFSDADRERFVEVSLHLQRAIGVSRAIRKTRGEAELSTLERLGRAAMLVGSDGRIMSCNALAAGLMTHEFRVRAGKLVAVGKANQDRIDRLLHEIGKADSGSFLDLPPTMIARDGVPWLALEALPLGTDAAEACDGARVILTVRSLAERGAPAAAAMRAIYGLTGAEARLTAALCRGETLDEAAEAFGVRKVTVRSQLQSILAKTGTRRQAELVALLART
jgi:DNA-binding CsgD family transcriptional regulator